MANQQNLSDAGLVLCLDIDGVLHWEVTLWNSQRGIHVCPKLAPGHSLFEWQPIVEAALAPFPQVKLVLSSTRCVWPGFGKTLKRFPPVMRGSFVGGPFHKRVQGADPWVRVALQELTRRQPAWQAVQRRKPAQWLTSAGEHVWQHWFAINKVADAVDLTNEVLSMKVPK